MRQHSPIWHPFTQHGLQPDAIEITHAAGAWLTTRGDRRILDAISSWWVTTHGHCDPRIMAAIKAQAAELDQVMFAGFTHAPAERLAGKLVSIVPPGLGHVFFSDSGSTSVEVAIKMALGHWRNLGEPRTRILALEHGYHGDTVGAMSAGARGVFTNAYEPLLFDVVRIPFPHTGRAQATLDALAAAAAGRTAAAFIVEPLILGAGGMLTYSPHVLAEMARICGRSGTLLIADEVMTGWGRTGTLFACEQAGITPDILCTAKGLTGGSLPLAATLCRAEIFESHRSPDRAKTFFHSSSYTANPLACAAAIANIDTWQTEPVVERVQALASMQAERIARLAASPRLENARQLGTITAVDLMAGGSGYLAQAAPKLFAFFAERDILLRPLGNTIYVLPPYCITAAELDQVYDAILEAADLFAR